MMFKLKSNTKSNKNGMVESTSINKIASLKLDQINQKKIPTQMVWQNWNSTSIVEMHV
jgi:hypothetical protein